MVPPGLLQPCPDEFWEVPKHQVPLGNHCNSLDFPATRRLIPENPCMFHTVSIHHRGKKSGKKKTNDGDDAKDDANYISSKRIYRNDSKSSSKKSRREFSKSSSRGFIVGETIATVGETVGKYKPGGRYGLALGVDMFGPYVGVYSTAADDTNFYQREKESKKPGPAGKEKKGN